MEVLLFLLIVLTGISRCHRAHKETLGKGQLKVVSSIIDRMKAPTFGTELNYDQNAKNRYQDDADFLLHTGLRMRFAGLSILQWSEFTSQQFAEARQYLLKSEKFWRLIIFRSVIVSMIAAGARLVVLELINTRDPARSAFDLILVIMAGLFVVGMLWAIQRHLPRFWFWGRTLSEEGKNWLLALTDMDIANGLDVSDQLAGLKRQELMTGLSTKVERLSLMKSWCAQKNLECITRLERLEELLPLVEIIGLGLPVGLLLGLPLMSLLGSGI